MGNLALRARQFELQTFEALLHGPAVVGFEGRPEEERKPADERVSGGDQPVEGDVSEWAVGNEGPDAAADEIAGGFEGDQVGWLDVGCAGFPFEGIGQPAAGEQAYAVRAGVGYGEIYGRPPARVFEGAAEDNEDFLRGASDAPASDEAVSIRRATGHETRIEYTQSHESDILRGAARDLRFSAVIGRGRFRARCSAFD